MRPLFCLAFASLALGFAPAPIPKPVRSHADPSKADLAALQGSWFLIRMRHAANSTSYVWGPRLEVSGPRFIGVGWLHGDIFFNQSEAASAGTFRLSARQHLKVISIWHNHDLSRPGLEALYSLEGDTLTICHSPEGARPCPTDLSPGGGKVVLIYSRKRPE